MSGIKTSGLDEQMAIIDKLLSEFPEDRKEHHNKAGQIVLKKVKDKTKYDTKRKKGSHLRDAIYSKVGDKGGYVAVRADYSGRVTGHAAPHAHLVEFGHVQKDKDGVSTGLFVKGKHMFENGLKESEGELLQLAEELANKHVEELE